MKNRKPKDRLADPRANSRRRARSIGPTLAAAAAAALLVPLGLGWLRLPAPPRVEATSGLALVFLAGVLAGGLSCLAVQGGLLATAVARRSPGPEPSADRLGTPVVPLLSFLAAKIAAYTALGFLLGYVGSFLTLSPLLRGLLQVAIGVFMVIVALQLLDVHPAFRHLAIVAPKPLQRLIRRQSRHGGALTPLALGALTVFIPCGVTQAMELVAMATADPLRGAAVMFAFTLGTVPLFFALGLAAMRLSQTWQNGFRTLAAAVLVLAAFVVVSGLRMAGLVPAASGRVAAGNGSASVAGYVAGTAAARDASEAAAPAAVSEEVIIQVVDHGYVPDRVTVKAGVPIRLKLVTDNVFGCARAFTIPALGVERILPSTGIEYVDLPAQAPGQLAFVCSMGMYGGTIEVNP